MTLKSLTLVKKNSIFGCYVVLFLLGCQTQSESAFHFFVFFFPCHGNSCLSLPCLVVSLCIESSVRILLDLRGLG